MRSPRGELWKDYAFLGLLAVFCVVISFFQLRWTGELTRAELSRLAENQQSGAKKLTQEFDRELKESIAQLRPDSTELTAIRMESKIKDWQKQGYRPVFKRIAIALPRSGKVSLQIADSPSVKLVDSDWPGAWSRLKENFSAKARGDSGPPYEDGTGLLMECPIFGNGGNDDTAGEQGWLILELDRDQLREWLTELCRRHFNADGEGLLRIQVAMKDGALLFSQGTGSDTSHTVALSFHPSTLLDDGPDNQTVWKLRVSRQVDHLEEMAQKAEYRNMALALMVNALILTAGYALTRNARKQRELAEAQMQFVANISHELRTPVTVILGAGHNLKRGLIQKPEAIARYAELILQHGQHLSQMIEEILAFASSHHQQVIQSQPINLQQLIQQVIRENESELKQMEMELHLPQALPFLSGDPEGLRRVLRNLISNAAKHGASGGWIGIRASHRAVDRVEITISDRGPGISRHEQSEIFRPFFRGEKARTNQIRGSGIGLSLVKEIVTAHHGTISVCSDIGKGTSFTVTLPSVSNGESKNPDH